MGTLTYEYHMSIAANMIGAFNGIKTSEDVVAEQAKLAMTFLPKGTKYLGYCIGNGPAGLTVPYVMAFEHPCFKDGTKIDTDWVREIYPGDDGSVQQINLFLGVRYYNPDGTPKYNHMKP